MNRAAVRSAFFCVLISLPAAMVVGVGAYNVVRDVPKAIRQEPRRISGVYRDVAEGIAESPDSFASIAERPKGWRQNGRINGSPWGYAAEPGAAEAAVWWRRGERDFRVARVPAERPFPYALVFYGGGGVVAVVLVGLTAFALACFRRFMRERDDFLAATAHDLTTPLVGMRYMIGRDDGEARRLNERMLLIVENIKEFMRLGGRRRPPKCEDFDVAALAREAYALFAADYDDLGQSVAFSGDGPLRVRADETWTLQILWNLFGNDLKYAAPYGRVEVRFRREGGFACVEFADEGQGMTRRQMRRAFDRYYRAKDVLKSGKGGFGIGLCAAREFARAMGGGLSVRANSPRGCVFALRLPVAAMPCGREGNLLFYGADAESRAATTT